MLCVSVNVHLSTPWMMAVVVCHSRTLKRGGSNVSLIKSNTL